MNIYSHPQANEYFSHTVEYMVKKKADSAIVLKRFLIVFLTLIIGGAVCGVTFRYVPPLGAVLIILIAFVIKVLWSMTSFEFEYTIIQGEMTMDKIVGARKRANVCSFLIRNADSIAPYDGKLPNDAYIIDACASPADSDTWCAVYTDEDTKKTALLFSACNKALDIMSYYNKAAVSSERIKDDISA